jgi:hypothetical protein
MMEEGDELSKGLNIRCLTKMFAMKSCLSGGVGRGPARSHVMSCDIRAVRFRLVRLFLSGNVHLMR